MCIGPTLNWKPKEVYVHRSHFSGKPLEVYVHRSDFRIEASGSLCASIRLKTGSLRKFKCIGPTLDWKPQEVYMHRSDFRLEASGSLCASVRL